MKHEYKIRKQAFDLFRQGHGSRYAARKIGASRKTLANWRRLFLAGCLDWLTPGHRKIPDDVLLQAVLEYAGSDDSANAVAVRHGMSAATLIRAHRNLLDYGVVHLRNPGACDMNKQKHSKPMSVALAEGLARLDELMEKDHLTKRDYKEIRDQLVVHICVIEEVEKLPLDPLKKKQIASSKKFLTEKLAVVERAISSACAAPQSTSESTEPRASQSRKTSR